MVPYRLVYVYFLINAESWGTRLIDNIFLALGILLINITYVSRFVLQRIKFLGASLPLTWVRSWRWLSVHALPPCFVQPAGIQIQKSPGLKISYPSTQATTMAVLSSYAQVGSCHCLRWLLGNFPFSFLSLFLKFYFIYFLIFRYWFFSLFSFSVIQCVVHVCDVIARFRVFLLSVLQLLFNPHCSLLWLYFWWFFFNLLLFCSI